MSPKAIARPNSRDDSFGTTLQRHLWRYYFVLFCSNIPRQRLGKCSGSPIRTIPKKMLVFTRNIIDISVDCTCMHKRRCKNRACLIFWRQRREMVSCRLGRLKCFFANMYRRQCGPVVRALALRSGDPGYKTRFDHSLNLILVVPGSTSQLHL